MSQKELTEIPFEEAEFCVVDVETTGMHPGSCRIIEIGLVRIKNLKIKETFRSFVNPGMEVPYFITTLTGISNRDVYDAPYFDEIAEQVEDFIGSSILVGHNLQFDLSFLKKSFDDCGKGKLNNSPLCTLKLARKIYPELPSKSLNNVIKFLKIRNKNVHRALGDATVTAKVLMKMIKELKDKYSLEYVSELLNYQYYSITKPSDHKLIKKKLIADLAKLPDLPGVYFFKNSKNDIIYVGKAKSLKNRVKSYFASTAPSKGKKIVRAASRLEFMVTNSELTALITEAEMVKLYNPKFNTMLKKFGNNFFIKVTSSFGYARTEVARNFDFDDNDYFGPYTNGDLVQNLQKVIERTFRLRECKDKEFQAKKGCYLAQIERCISPCTSEGLLEEYEAELKNVYDFLAGKNQFAVNRLIARMKDLSDRHRYEEASEIRDLINLVLSQIQKTSILAEPVNSTQVLVEIQTTGKKDFILMLSGKIYIKDYLLLDEDSFDGAIEDYFNGTLFASQAVNKKDLEKIKITLNWLIRNRNSVKVYYLKDFRSKNELYKHITSGRTLKIHKPPIKLDIRNFID
ncbi:MAG: exonuclease domain-containing protein [Bacteroidota bacterium]|nr:exonuclease domain-containing protein [Bacteroidota bacterium]